MSHSRYYSAENLASLKACYEQPVAAEQTNLMTGFPPAEANQVGRHNWLTPPFNQWAFHHLERLLPTIRLSPAKQPTPLPSSHSPLGNPLFTSVCGERFSLQQHLQASHTDAFLVLHKGEVLAEHYFNQQRADQQHIMFSVTKSLIGLLAEHLINNGELPAELTVTEVIPELAGSAFGDASLRQLLDMAVGIDYREIYDDPDSESSQFGYACGFNPAPAAWQDIASLYDYLPRLKKRGEHGGFFHYVTATTEVLAWVIERVTGKACHEHWQPLWQQAGAGHDGYFVADPKGRNVCGAGFNATARDMARLGQLILQSASNSEASTGGLNSTVINILRAGNDPAILAADDDFSFWTPGASYKSQWYVFQQDTNAIMAGGIHGQYLYVDFDAELVIVKQSSLPVAVSNIDSDSVALFRSLARSLL